MQDFFYLLRELYSTVLSYAVVHLTRSFRAWCKESQNSRVMWTELVLLGFCLLLAVPVVATRDQKRAMKRGCTRMVTSIFGRAQDLVTQAVFGKEQPTMKQFFYECFDKSMAGEPVKMEKFRGNVLLCVNVASK